MLLRLNAVPMSAKAAILTASLIMGMRYSKFPSNCVSPPTDVNERGKLATLLPEDPVNVPSVIAACGGSPVTCWIGPAPVDENTTLREVMNESTGAIGLIERTFA